MATTKICFQAMSAGPYLAQSACYFNVPRKGLFFVEGKVARLNLIISML